MCNQWEIAMYVQVVLNAVGGVRFPGKKRYEGVRFNVFSITGGVGRVQISRKKHYLTLEWPLLMLITLLNGTASSSRE